MSGASIETTLEFWAASLRDIKAWIQPLFTQTRVAAQGLDRQHSADGGGPYAAGGGIRDQACACRRHDQSRGCGQAALRLGARPTASTGSAMWRRPCAARAPTQCNDGLRCNAAVRRCLAIRPCRR
jgi:hypothetical protein